MNHIGASAATLINLKRYRHLAGGLAEGMMSPQQVIVRDEMETRPDNEGRADALKALAGVVVIALISLFDGNGRRRREKTCTKRSRRPTPIFP